MRRGRVKLLAVTALAGAIVTTNACASSTGTSAPTATSTTAKVVPTTQPQTIVASDPKDPIAAKLGQTFEIRVDVDPTRDARWQVDQSDAAMVFFLGEQPDQKHVAPGTPATDVLVFRAQKAGTTHVVLRFGAPDGASPSDKRVTFTVNVT